MFNATLLANFYKGNPSIRSPDDRFVHVRTHAHIVIVQSVEPSLLRRGPERCIYLEEMT